MKTVQAGQTRGRRSHGNTVLSGTGFGNDAGFAHASGQQNLSQTIIYLVRSGMVQFVAFQINFCTAKMLSEPLGEI